MPPCYKTLCLTILKLPRYPSWIDLLAAPINKNHQYENMKRIGIVFYTSLQNKIYLLWLNCCECFSYSHICSINNRTLVLVLSHYWSVLAVPLQLQFGIVLHNPIFQKGTCTHVSLTTAPMMRILLVSEDFRFFVKIQLNNFSIYSKFLNILIK